MIDTRETKVFVVDDDICMRKALRRLITASGYNVEVFSTAEDFLRSDNYNLPAILILDLRMPGMSGIELQKSLRETGISIPIIFITAHDDAETINKLKVTDAVAVLHKPVEESTLLDAISKAKSHI